MDEKEFQKKKKIFLFLEGNSMVIRYGGMLDNEEALPITAAAAALITCNLHL